MPLESFKRYLRKLKFLLNPMSIPKRPGLVWDGSSIFYTKDCDGCRYYRKIGNYNLCGVSMSFKYLVIRDKQKRCALINRLADLNPEQRAVKYLDEIIADIQRKR